MAKDGDKDPFELRLDYQNSRDMTAAPRLSAEIKALYAKMSSDNAAAMRYVFLSLLSFVLVPFGVSFAISGVLVLVLALVVMSHVSSTRKLKIIYSFSCKYIAYKYSGISVFVIKRNNIGIIKINIKR